jgi:hypothetical protein
MNQFVDSLYVESVKRLALGLEPLDAVLGGRISQPITVDFPEKLRGLPRPDVDRHPSCLHVLIYQAGVKDNVNLRFSEPSRRFCPRQIQYPILTIAQAEALDYRNRVRKPSLFPGAAYDVAGCTTGIRGRVERKGSGKKIRWSRVTATLVNNGGTVIAHAHGDDRGEFLLILPPAATHGSDLVDPAEVRVDVFGPAVDPVPVPPDLASLDPFWDLPTEVAIILDPAHPDQDTISRGTVNPPGYVQGTPKTIKVPLGIIYSETTAFEIP